MGKINWARVFLCGLLTGFVWTLLLSVALVFFGEEFLQAVRPGIQSGGVKLFLFFSNLAGGVFGIWLYAILRPHTGPGPKTAVIAGIAWWFIVSLQSAKWVALGFVPTKAALGLLLPTLPAIILAALVGAWLYKDSVEKVG